MVNEAEMLEQKVEELIKQNAELLDDNKQLREQIWLLLSELRRQSKSTSQNTGTKI